MTTTAQGGRPEFFIDKSLGAKKLRVALEEKAFIVHTVNREYGVHVKVLDPRWIRDAGGKGWLILTKDDVRTPDVQLRDIEAALAKVFWLPDAQLKAKVFVPRFIKHLDGMVRRGKRPGPFMYKVDEDALRIVQLRPPTPAPKGEQGSILDDDGR